MVTDVFRLLLHIGSLLDQLGMRYTVGGSLASGVHGELRATNDVDILIEIPEDRVPALVAALKPTFDVWEDTVREAVEIHRPFSALHLEWHVKVDFFPAGASPLDEHELDRRLAMQLPAAPDTDVYVASAEDIILRKLEWYRRSGGVLERQLRDVVGVMKLRGRSLDMAYLNHWAGELELSDLLTQVLGDAGIRG